MTIQAKYLISCLALLANCNVHAICNTGCDVDESQLGGTGYYASGSAHSSQYLLPNGEVVTSSKGNTFSSDGIQKTFHQLKHEANQFVSKQKDTVNIPNALPPLHSSFGQDLQSIQSLGQISQVGQVYPPQGFYNNLESSAHHQQVYTGAGGSQSSQAYYQTLPQTSKITSTKKEQVIVNKKVVSHGGSSSYGSGSELDEIETNQNKLDSNLNGDGIIYQPVPSYVNNVKVQSGNTQEEIETSKTNIRFPSVVVQAPSQTSSFSKYEQTVKHNSSSQAVPAFPVYIPNGQFTTGVLNLNDQKSFITSNVPNKVSAVEKLSSAQSEHHYGHSENKDAYYENVGSSIDSEVSNQQQEHKYDAIPVASLGPEMPIKIKYVYDGKTLKKYEEYSSGAIKNIPISIEESENTLREIQKQTSSQVSQSYIPQPVAHEKPESDGYYYYPKGQSLPYPSNVQTFKKEQSQSSHSQQSITGGNVDQFSHLPLNVNSQKQYYVPSSSGYVGVLPPSSQVKYESNAHSTDAFSQLEHENPAILVGGVPQVVPVVPVVPVPVSSQHSSFSSGSSSHSASYSGGQSGGFVYPSDSLASSQTSSDFIEKLSSLNSGSKLLNCGDCLTGIGSSNLPVKNSYGIATSFSSSSSNINGKKTENRHASVAVNDNGKVDTYNVKS